MDRYNKLKEEILILRCQIGDREAFAQLIKCYQKPLFYFISCLLEDQRAAQDVFQDTWLTVLKKIYTLRDPHAFSTWLYRIARNYVYKELKRRKTGLLPNGEDVAAVMSSEGDSFSPKDIEKIYESLPKLKFVHKEVLVLRFWEQMSYQEISQVTDCNLGTVRSRLYYAKQALKQEMEK